MSFLAIFLYHAFHISNTGYLFADFLSYLFNNLPLAIDVFFILSSFLLTYLALSEYKKRNNFSFKHYFTRRILRIWPLYFFIMVLAFLVFPIIASKFHTSLTLPNSLYYVFFIANLYTIDHVFFLKFLWTISVEEQFYLFWGFTLKFLHKKLGIIIAALFLSSISSSTYAIITGASNYYSTINYLFDFASGALAALYVFSDSRIIMWIRNLSRAGTYAFYLYPFCHFILFYFLDANSKGILNSCAGLLNRYLFIIYISLFIIEQMKNNSRTKILAQNKFLVLTGKLSYGLYCFHGITITFINLLFQHYNLNIKAWLLVPIYFIVNYLIAGVSYKYLELPFLKLKRRWRSI